MKKNIFAIALAFALTLCGCANQTDLENDDESDEKDDEVKNEQEKDSDEKEEAEAESEDSQEGKSEEEETKTPKLSDYTDEELIEMAKPAVEALDSCICEVYCADSAWDTSYDVIYKADKKGEGDYSQSQMILIDSLGDWSVEYEDGVEKIYVDGKLLSDDYYGVGTTNAYPITNFKTFDELYENLYQYMTKEFFDSRYGKNSVEGDILEYEGELYLLRGARGYGGYGYYSDGMEILYKGDNVLLMKVMSYDFSEEDEQIIVFVLSEDGKLLIDDTVFVNYYEKTLH